MITYDKYDKEIREAHLEIGKLKEQLRVATERADRYAGDSRRLKKAEAFIVSDHGFQWCERCNDYQAVDMMSGECEECVETEEARCTND